MRVVAALVLLLSVTVYAQDAQTPDADPELLASWRLNVQQAEKALTKADAVLRKTPEFKEFADAQKLLEQIRAAVQSAAAKKFPGYTFDVATGQLKKDVPKTASK